MNLNKEPAVLIGIAITIILGVVQTLMGEGIISDVAAGKITDLVNAAGQLIILLIPLITGIIVRGRVYSPDSYNNK